MKQTRHFRRRQIGLIIQFINLIPVLNVWNMICRCCLWTKTDKDHVDKIINTLGCPDRLKMPNQLSGDNSRVSIGRALISNPALMLAMSRQEP